MAEGKITGLAHIGICVADMDKSLDFYRRLGFVLDKEECTSVRLAFLSAGSCLLELIEHKNQPARPAGAGRSKSEHPSDLELLAQASRVVDHIAVEVDDIQAAIANATAKGIAIDANAVGSAPILGGIQNVFFEGPDGERLEFFAYGA